MCFLAGSTVLVSKRSEASAMVAAVLEAAATPGNRHEANKRAGLPTRPLPQSRNEVAAG